MRIVLSRVRDDGSLDELADAQTGNDGRTDGPLAEGAGFPPGLYQLDFHVGAYFGSASDSLWEVVPVRFRAGEGHYHIPLLVSPYGCSTYRGS